MVKLLKLILKKYEKRSEKLINLGFEVPDADHVTFVKMVKAEFISYDKRLVKKIL